MKKILEGLDSVINNEQVADEDLDTESVLDEAEAVLDEESLEEGAEPILKVWDKIHKELLTGVGGFDHMFKELEYYERKGADIPASVMKAFEVAYKDYTTMQRSLNRASSIMEKHVDSVRRGGGTEIKFGR